MYKGDEILKINKNFCYFSLGRVISFIGSGIQSIAIPLYILDATGKGSLMGLFSLFSLLPLLLTAPFAGILGDRKNRKLIMVWTDYARGVIIFILGILAAFNQLNIIILFIFQIFVSIMDSFFNASSSAIFPDLITKEELMKSNSLKGALDSTSMLLGPILGGMIYGILGIKMVFFINSISFILSGVCEMLISYKKDLIKKEKMSIKLFISENREVLSYMLKNKGLFQMFSFAMTANLIGVPISTVLYPYIFRKVIGFSSEQYGYLEGLFTCGILIGNVIMAVKLSKVSPKKLMKTGFIFTPIFEIFIAILVFPSVLNIFTNKTWLIFSIIGLLLVFTGIFNSIVNTPLGTNLQKLVPDAIRSRFFALLGLFAQIAIPLGSVVYGVLLDKTKPFLILFAAVLMFFIVSIVFIFTAVDEVYNPRNI